MRYFLTLVVGVIAGAVLAYFLFVGTPRFRVSSRDAMSAPETGGDPPGTVVVALDEKFFDALLTSVFRDLNPPTFPLQARAVEDRFGSIFARYDKGARPVFLNAQSGCQSQVVIMREGGGVKTGVRFDNGKIVAPLAFSGSYLVPLVGQCVSFSGAAQAGITLRFDESKQTLFGEIDVESVNLENAPALNGVLQTYVQNAINNRVNPIQVLSGAQLAINAPVQASKGTLRAQVKDIRYEVKDNALRLYITYDFSGARKSS